MASVPCVWILAPVYDMHQTSIKSPSLITSMSPSPICPSLVSGVVYSHAYRCILFVFLKILVMTRTLLPGFLASALAIFQYAPAICGLPLETREDRYLPFQPLSSSQISAVEARMLELSKGR
jgi:hypothetical protein